MIYLMCSFERTVLNFFHKSFSYHCFSLIIENGLVAQLVRAPPCHGGGRGFEPHPGRLQFIIVYSMFNGIIAQLGEHLPYKQRVIGSSPIGPTLPTWLNGRAADL